MPKASHRLDILVVPKDPAARPEARARAWLQTQASLERTTGRGEQGTRASELVPGGFVRVRVDVPPGMVIFGNRLGGFHVRCPSCAANLVRPFAQAWSGRQGTVPRVACAACGGDFSANDLHTAPQIEHDTLEQRSVQVPAAVHLP